MFIKRLGIKKFRNYSDVEAEFNSKKIYSSAKMLKEKLTF